MAVAARDRAKANKFASKHGIGRVHDSYDACSRIPTSTRSTTRCRTACTAGGPSPRSKRASTCCARSRSPRTPTRPSRWPRSKKRTGLVVMEAFHYRYHPLADRLVEIAHDGTLGEIEHIHTWMVIPLLPRSDIRWQLDLAGGSTMDVGLLHDPPAAIAGAGRARGGRRTSARERSPGVDRWLQADMASPTGARDGSRRRCCPVASSLGAEVKGDKGVLRVLNHDARSTSTECQCARPQAPAEAEASVVAEGDHVQLPAASFAGAVLRRADQRPPAHDAIANMRVIDAAYSAAGTGAAPTTCSDDQGCMDRPGSLRPGRVRRRGPASCWSTLTEGTLDDLITGSRPGR